jgi:sodium transport system permease protein
MRGAILVLKKELVEFSKDKKTIFFSFGLPLILYPLIFTMISTLVRRDATQRKAKPSRVVLIDPSGALKAGLQAESQKFTLVEAPADLAKAIADDQVDLQVEVAPEAAALRAEGRTFPLTVKSDENTSASLDAFKRFQDFLAATKGRLIEQRFEAIGAKKDLSTPFEMKKVEVGDDLRAISRIMGMWLPYTLMISMYMGAMQHGAYLSAGERERGTLMSLLATRLLRRDIILGKQLALFTISIGIALASLTGMAMGFSRFADASTNVAVAGASQAAKIGGVLDFNVLLLTLLLLVPLGLLFTAVVMLVGVQSRNTREAGTALTPGIFVVVLFGMFTSAPGIEKMAALPWIPLLNTSVAIRKLFAHQLVAWEYAVALGMTVALAAIATALAARILNRESALFRA